MSSGVVGHNTGKSQQENRKEFFHSKFLFVPDCLRGGNMIVTGICAGCLKIPDALVFFAPEAARSET